MRGRWHVCYGSGLSIIIVTVRQVACMKTMCLACEPLKIILLSWQIVHVVD